jgi:glycosyltransferase involved in cell wall biosynthesis
MGRRATRTRRLVVIAVPDFEPTIGGTSRQTRNLAEALQAAGREVVVLAQRTDPTWAARERRDGVPIERIGPGSRGRLAMKLFVARAALWFLRRRRRIDAVVVIMYPDLALAAAAAGLGTHTLMGWAGLGDASDTLAVDGLRAPLARVRRAVLRRAHHLALTDPMRDELVGCGIASAHVEVVPTPVDTVRFRPATASERATARAAIGADGGSFVVVYTGHFRRSKRVERLVEAAGALRDDGVDVQLLLLGDSRPELDDSTAAVAATIERTGLAPVTLRPGPVADVVPYLHAADAFVLPSEREGLSNSLLEAMACGLACVAPASAGGAEMLGDGSGAPPIVVPPDNSVPALHAALAALAADPSERARLGAAARTAAGRAARPVVDGALVRLVGAVGGAVGGDAVRPGAEAI